MDTNKHDLRDLLARGDIDKKKLYDGFLKGEINGLFIKHWYHRNKDGFHKYKRDVFEVRLDDNDYLLNTKEKVNDYEQHKYGAVLLELTFDGTAELYNHLIKHTFIPRIDASADSFPVDGMKIMKEMGVLDE
jgi:hypothetical protein